jgi:hypothetical protein
MVTVTDDGPVMANLLLDGILPHDVTTRADYDATEALVTGADLPYLLLTDDERAVAAGTLYLTIRNPAEQELQVKARFMHDHDVRMEPNEIIVTVAAKSEREVAIALSAAEAVPTDKPVLLQLHWTMGFDLADKDSLSLSGTKEIPLRPSSINLIQTVAPEFEHPLSVSAVQPPKDFTLHYTMDGNTPTVSSPVYERPLPIDQAATVKARFFNRAGHGTATSTQSYKPVREGSGFHYRVYKGNWTRMPDYRKLTPVFEGVAMGLDVESRQLWPDNWGMVLEGNFQVDRSGDYTFHLKSDDGSKLYIDDRLVIDNDGDHSLLELKNSTKLSAGTHQIRIEFFEAGGEAVLELDVEGPGMERQPLPIEKVSH